MKRTYTSEIRSQLGKEIKLQGWTHIIRDQSKIIFIILRDIHGLCQCVITTEMPEIFEQAKRLRTESVIEILGEVKEEKQAPGGYEISVKKLIVLSEPLDELPIPVVEKQESETEQSTRLDWRWIDLRKPDKSLIFKTWTTMESLFRNFLIEKDFMDIHSPKLMSTPSESGAELFEVKYFERTAYLAQSPQFYKQMAMSAGFEKIFEVGPIFRANPSFTSRHDTEFTGFDFEISFIESHQDIIKIEEELLQHIINGVKEKHGEAIKSQFGRELIIPTIPFPQVTMVQAKEILKTLKIESEREDDLSPEEERELSKFIKDKYNHEFVFITEYPISIRPFYHMRFSEKEGITKSFDLLWNGVEITTGAQREHRYEILKQQAIEKGLSMESIKHYMNFFKYGCPPHGGCGIGPSRIIMKIFDLPNVREATYLYRGVKRLTP
ncbi:MAG: aspartate--tRNA(Asn) ligase [bacterium]